jgi:drug/metabolite transporter, DME family
MSFPLSHGRARLGLLQVSLAGVLWGTGGLVMQLIRDRAPMSVLVVSTWRMVLAALVLFAALLVTRGFADLRRLMRRRPGTAIVVGMCTGAYQALYFGAVLAVGVTVSTVVALGLAPVLLTLAESIAARQRPTRMRLLVLGAALGGLVLVSADAGTSTTGPHPLLGVLLAAASGSTYALATGIGRPLTGLTSPLALTTATSTAGALALLPFGLLAGGPYLPADPEVLGLLVYLGVATLAVAYALLYAGLRTVRGSAALVATLLEPVTAAVLAAIVLGERLGALGLVGAALILVAVAGLEEEEETGGAVPEGPTPL